MHGPRRAPSSEVTATPDAEELERTYAVTVGARLRAVRRQKRLSLQAVAAASGQEFKASVLGAYERGERAISVPRLQRLARLYDVPVEQLLPGELPGDHGEVRSSSDLNGRSKIRINLTQLKQSPGEVPVALQRFLYAIQVERQDFNGEVLTIRADDLRVIGATFGFGVEEMITRLDDLGLIVAG